MSSACSFATLLHKQFLLCCRCINNYCCVVYLSFALDCSSVFFARKIAREFAQLKPWYTLTDDTLLSRVHTSTQQAHEKIKTDYVRSHHAQKTQQHTLSKITNGGQTESIHASFVSRGTRNAYPRKRRPRSLQPPLYPPAPADTRDGAGLARGAVLRVHARTPNERRKYRSPPCSTEDE